MMEFHKNQEGWLLNLIEIKLKSPRRQSTRSHPRYRIQGVILHELMGGNGGQINEGLLGKPKPNDGKLLIMATI